jgi:hypothetical protein
MMRQLRLLEPGIEYIIISLLAFLVMRGLLVDVIGAPDNLPVWLVALLCGVSFTGLIGSFICASDEGPGPR